MPHGSEFDDPTETAIVREWLGEFRDILKRACRREERFSGRKVVFHLPATDYDAHRARAVRKALGISQRLLADFLGVSVETVRSWEVGRQVPSRIATRFLDELAHDPERA